MTSPVTQAAVAHYQSVGVMCIEVPEWKVDGKPAKIFYRPLTVDERALLFKGDANSKTDADVLILKALNQDESKMFTLEDKPFLLQHVDSGIVLRVATSIVNSAGAEIKN
jgi:hypothetical protein